MRSPTDHFNSSTTLRMIQTHCSSVHQRLARRPFNAAFTVASLSPSKDASFRWQYGTICDARSSHMRKAGRSCSIALDACEAGGGPRRCEVQAQEKTYGLPMPPSTVVFVRSISKVACDMDFLVLPLRVPTGLIT